MIVRDHSRLIQMKFSSWESADIDTPLKKKLSGVTRSIPFMYPCIKTISFMELVQNAMFSSDARCDRYYNGWCANSLRWW